MNYIDLLTQEEKPILCRIITGRDFKELYIKHALVHSDNWCDYERRFRIFEMS